MRRWLGGVVMVVGLSGWAAAQEAAGPTEPAYLYRAEVLRVIDGDTIDVDIDLGFYTWIKNQRVRLLDIDTPEPKGATKQAGEAATSFLREMIDKKAIIIRTVKGRDQEDREDSFGRWLAVIYLNGVNVNESLLKAGHAAPYDERKARARN